MYVKKLRRKCSVRGCSNTDTYSISHSSEAGNTVIICKSCLGKALNAIDEAPYEPQTRVAHQDAPSLSLHKPKKAVVAKAQEAEPSFADVIEAVADAVDTNAAETSTEDSTATPPADAPEFVCPHCGQVCKSELGLRSHINAKHKDVV